MVSLYLMNHHPHPPHARAKKRLSLGKEVDKRGVSEKESFPRTRAGKHHNTTIVSQLYSLVEHFHSEHRKLKKDQNLFWREKRERKNAWKNKSAQKQRARERERDDMFVLLRVIQKNHRTYRNK